MQRRNLIEQIVVRIPDAQGSDCTLVGIDGRDGSGKTTFADEFANVCQSVLSRPVIRISLDDFHNVRSLRYRRGKASPEGFYLDSYDYNRFHAFVGKSLSAGGSRQFKYRCHDLDTDEVLDLEPFEEAPPGAIVVVDGLFLHRPELVSVWNYSVYLDVTAEECAQRMMVRDGAAPQLIPTDRYFGGIALYLDACHPKEKASVVVDNNQVGLPYIVDFVGDQV
ncbi:hypothetical protein VHEMI08227 [[Torrubiella] hemipterigena]|uniref:Phosphoribulokinase/uridine kinase domain-containing protein n=1 Tax=[Torrubiella] hemipterigena TaxID=1531966 RepID=A0A0A1TN28_9HYPO|nr:hypothetical protein VHEMI08227 [[Torrubiella] hemipterigena]